MSVYLLDSNILLRLFDQQHPHYQIAQWVLARLPSIGDELMICPQTLFEFWSVATRPATARDGLGLSITEADNAINHFLRLYPLLPNDPALFTTWHRLVTNYACSGPTAHDARYLAAAIVAGDVTHILTFNFSHFTRFIPEGIPAVNPSTLIVPPSP